MTFEQESPEVSEHDEEILDSPDDMLSRPRLLSVVPADLAQILADIDEDK